MTFDEFADLTYIEMRDSVDRYNRRQIWKFDKSIERYDKSTEHCDKLIKSGNFLAENQDV